MISLILAIALQLAPAPVATHCETVGPRLDGVKVEICDGAAVAYTDAAGNTVRVSDWR